ncbi:hypothetical protein AGMMS50249_2580 [candidate division SR1 bacterium]|nr:hypothetical protein AGMMS50249_2580 [candidate division SR1 bacterium]
MSEKYTSHKETPKQDKAKEQAEVKAQTLEDLKKLQEKINTPQNAVDKLFRNQTIANFSSGKMATRQATAKSDYEKNLGAKMECLEGFERMLKNGDVAMIIKKIEQKNIEESIKIPYDIVFLAIEESKWKVSALSEKGAAGYWQFIPSTAKAFGLAAKDRNDKLKSTDAALKHFVANFKIINSWTEKGKLNLSNETKRKRAFQLYNAGPTLVKDQFSATKGNHDKYQSKSSESNNYVPKILAVRQIISAAINRGEFNHILKPQMIADKKPDQKQEKKTETKQQTNTQITKSPEITVSHKDFKFERDSTDGNYRIYSYVVQSGGTPGAVKNRFIEVHPQVKPRQDTIQVTDKKAVELPKTQPLNRGEEVFIRIKKA